MEDNKGRDNMMDELMKTAFDAEIYKNNDGDITIIGIEGDTSNYHRGDKVKVIIIKEEE